MPEIQMEPVFEDFEHFGCLVLSQHAIVDEDAVEPVAYCLVDEGGDNRGIDTSAEGADHLSVAHLRLYLFRHHLNERLCGKETFDLADLVEEVLQNQLALWCVMDLRMELETVDLAILLP